MRCDPRVAKGLDESGGDIGLADDPGAQRIVDVVVEVGDAIDHPHDVALERAGRIGPTRMAEDAVAHRLGQVESPPVAFEHLDDPQRLLVVPEALAEACLDAGVQRALADVTERRMAEVVANADRLDQVLVESQGPRHRARDLGDLDRVGETRAVVIALGQHEHLGLVLEPPERLGVDDAVAVALERGTQPAVRFGHHTHRRIGAHRQRTEVLALTRDDALGEGVSDGSAGVTGSRRWVHITDFDSGGPRHAPSQLEAALR